MEETLNEITAIMYKCLIAIFVTFFLSEDWIMIIYALTFLIFIDLILGVWVAVKEKKVSSWKLSKTADKMGKYSLAMATAYLIYSVNSGFEWLVSAIGIFFVLTEALSNFEKLSLLGLKMPTVILSKINEQFKDLQKARKEDNNKKGEIKNEILKKK